MQQKRLNDLRNNLKINFYAYQKDWMDNLKDWNKHFDKCKKELITLDRFNYNINAVKELDTKMRVFN